MHPIGKRLLRRPRTQNISSDNVTHQLLVGHIGSLIAQGAGAGPSLYSHIAQSKDQDSTSLPKAFKSARGQGRKKGKGKSKLQQQS